MGWYLILATIPVSVFGHIFSDQIETGARNLWLIAVVMIALAGALYLAERHGTRTPRRGAAERDGRDRCRRGAGARPHPGCVAIWYDHYRGPVPRPRPPDCRPVLVPALGTCRRPVGCLRGPQGRRADRPGARSHAASDVLRVHRGIRVDRMVHAMDGAAQHVLVHLVSHRRSAPC